MERAQHAWATGDIEKVRAGISPELPAAIGAFGSYDVCRRSFEQYWEAGIGTLGVTVSPAASGLATLEPFAELAAAVTQPR
jgi:hypothetical protein